MTSPRQIAKSIGTVSLGTIFSRILGYLRDMLIANRFGASIVSDAFFVAWRIPNTLRELLGEGALSAAFIPVFAEYIKTKEKKEAWFLASLVINALLLISIVITLLGIVLAPIIVTLTAPGFIGQETFSLAVTLTRIMFPFTIFICLAALVMGILNSCQHFTLPALAPAVLNLCMIISILFLCPFFTSQPIFGLSIGLLLGGLVQLLIQLPGLIKEKIQYQFVLNPFHPGVKRIVKLMLPRALGSAITQLNTTISNIMASFLASGSISALFYANRLVQLPMAIFGVAIGTVLFPTMASQAAEGRIDQLKGNLRWGLKMVILTSLPATVGLMVLGKPIIQLLLEHGEFGTNDTLMTHLALFFYASGLIGFSALKVIVPAFYAQHDTCTPVKIGIIAMLANVIFALLLMQPLAQGGLTLANSLAAFLNLSLLLIILRKRLGLLGGKEILACFLKTLIASSVMAAFCYFILGSVPTPLSQVVIGSVGGIVVFLVACKLIRLPVWGLINRTSQSRICLTD